MMLHTMSPTRVSQPPVYTHCRACGEPLLSMSEFEDGLCGSTYTNARARNLCASRFFLWLGVRS